MQTWLFTIFLVISDLSVLFPEFLQLLRKVILTSIEIFPFGRRRLFVSIGNLRASFVLSRLNLRDKETVPFFESLSSLIELLQLLAVPLTLICSKSI